MKEVFTKHGFTTAAIDLIVGNLVVEGETSLRKFQTYLGYLAALDPARQTSWQDVFASVRSLGVSEPAMPKWMDMMEVQLRQGEWCCIDVFKIECSPLTARRYLGAQPPQALQLTAPRTTLRSHWSAR